MKIYLPTEIYQNHLSFRIYSYLHTRHHQAILLFLNRVICHQPKILHIWLHRYVYILLIHGLYHLSTGHHRYLHQHGLIFLFHLLYHFASTLHRCYHRSRSDTLYHVLIKSKHSILLHIGLHLVIPSYYDAP